MKNVTTHFLIFSFLFSAIEHSTLTPFQKLSLEASHSSADVRIVMYGGGWMIATIDDSAMCQSLDPHLQLRLICHKAS